MLNKHFSDRIELVFFRILIHQQVAIMELIISLSQNSNRKQRCDNVSIFFCRTWIRLFGNCLKKAGATSIVMPGFIVLILHSE
mmetsp:Transcript_17139/g.34849  ORF Transcript_17139/g.34849 Transcript_17139/m.34849 type:complete len:83 (+) Transcript_17139:2164-2412(+)